MATEEGATGLGLEGSTLTVKTKAFAAVLMLEQGMSVERTEDALKSMYPDAFLSAGSEPGKLLACDLNTPDILIQVG